MLESIPAEHLDERPRFERFLALARLCALNGSPTEARAWLREGQALANNAPRLVRSEIASWSLTHHVEPSAFEFSDEVVASASGHERMHVLQRQAISSLESGCVVDALVLHERFVALAAEVGDPAGIWQGKVLGATLAFDRGRWSAAEELSHEAEEYGERHAMQQAALVCLGQSFCRKLITGEQGQLVERFEEMPVNTDASTIAMAARALSLAARGRRDQAWSGVAATVQDALDRPRPSALVVLAILAGLVRDAADPETVERVRQRLAAFGDRSLVVGYGIATAGPVQRQLALLSNDPEETIEHLRDAVLVADRSGALTWQVVTRLGLARAAGTQAPVAEAASLAADTELESLLKAALSG
jgi:hypothetical protein